MVKIDLKAAYYVVSIHQESQSLLSFLWDDKSFRFTCLPFGFSYVPRVFTKVLKPVVAYLREKGHLYRRYSHNGWIEADSSRSSISDTRYSGDSRFLGELPKMHSPTHALKQSTFLVVLVNSKEMKFYLPQEKVTTIINKATTILNSPHQVSARYLARMIGLLSATIPVVLPAPLHYRHLQQMKNHLVLSGGYKNSGPLTKEAQLELKWWLQILHKVNGRVIKPSLPNMMIYTGASTWGWGARSEETTIGGTWNNTEIALHINCLELLGAWYATQASYRRKRISQFFTDRQQVSCGLYQQGRNLASSPGSPIFSTYA